MTRIIATLAAAALFTAPAAFGESYTSPSADATDWGVHDDGLLWLKVWNNGTVGDVRGSGIYPAPDGPANIYRGDFWVGARSRRGPGHHYRYDVVCPPEWNQRNQPHGQHCLVGIFSCVGQRKNHNRLVDQRDPSYIRIC